MFWNKKKPEGQKTPVETCGHALYEVLTQALKQGGRIRVEDLISAAAAIVGEACIDLAGDFSPRVHEFQPGQMVFSGNVNIIISGDKDLLDAPASSVVGILYSKLLACGYAKEDFPTLKEVYAYFPAHIGDAASWGKIPLSITKDHHPFIMPLRAAYETRATVDKLLAPLENNREQRLQAVTLTLVEALCQTKDVLDRKIATKLALETINGMAKTAPMTDAAMAKLNTEAAKKQVSS